MNDESPSGRGRLGRRIRQLRQQRGLSLRRLSAEVTGYSYSYLGRVELGRQQASKGLVDTLDDFFGTDGALALLREAEGEAMIAQSSRANVRLERDAVRIQVFTSSVIPGLLQTEDYARELFRSGLPGTPEWELEEWVAGRIQRQKILARNDPPFYWALMDETALRRPVLGHGRMAEQLRRVLSYETHPTVSVQVLPFDQGLHALLGGGLTVVTLPDGRNVGLVESFDAGYRVEAPADLLRQTQRLDLVRAKALPVEQSYELIRNYLKEHEHGQED